MTLAAEGNQWPKYFALVCVTDKLYISSSHTNRIIIPLWILDIGLDISIHTFMTEPHSCWQRYPSSSVMLIMHLLRKKISWAKTATEDSALVCIHLHSTHHCTQHTQHYTPHTTALSTPSTTQHTPMHSARPALHTTHHCIQHTQHCTAHTTALSTPSTTHHTPLHSAHPALHIHTTHSTITLRTCIEAGALLQFHMLTTSGYAKYKRDTLAQQIIQIINI